MSLLFILAGIIYLMYSCLEKKMTFLKKIMYIIFYTPYLRYFPQIDLLKLNNLSDKPLTLIRQMADLNLHFLTSFTVCDAICDLGSKCGNDVTLEMRFNLTQHFILKNITYARTLMVFHCFARNAKLTGWTTGIIMLKKQH